MGKRGNSNTGTIAIVALVAFAIGKLSGDDSKPEFEEAPQAFIDPVPTDQQPAWTYADSNPAETTSQRFVSDEPQTAFGSRSFRNCSHARAAGAAPVREGDPGYGSHLDRDGDGVGCE
ncbi:excalibur calcium-binding domain-containing protein [Sphingopyxis sp. 22461]|uniref:excalibur calcium-binding domain-containing protein n=1 Tax=Sphingopyxis sp. 22461 TaxID=3453923 RepID=UPI003F87D3FF